MASLRRIARPTSPRSTQAATPPRSTLPRRRAMRLIADASADVGSDSDAGGGGRPDAAPPTGKPGFCTPTARASSIRKETSCASPGSAGSVWRPRPTCLMASGRAAWTSCSIRWRRSATTASASPSPLSSSIREARPMVRRGQEPAVERANGPADHGQGHRGRAKARATRPVDRHVRLRRAVEPLVHR